MTAHAVETRDEGDAFSELERGVYAALQTYSNVHRGSGHASIVSTHLYEQARELVLEHLGLQGAGYTVVFCTPRRAAALEAQAGPGAWRSVSSRSLGLALGVTAVAIDREALPRGVPAETGGGMARLVAPGWVVWARAPGLFEPGTPAILNVIAFARALRLRRRFGPDVFRGTTAAPRPAKELLRGDAAGAPTGAALLEELRRGSIGRAVPVPTAAGDAPYVNLDHGASTPALAPAWAAFAEALRQPADAQAALVRETKAICAEVLGAPPEVYEVIFTSNTTEAINLVAASERRAPAGEAEPLVLGTMLEHNSNELPWRAGASPLRLQVDAEGFLDLGELEAQLAAHDAPGSRRIRLVTVSGASNVLGTFNDLAEIARVVHRHGARLLVDAAQLVAHRPVDLAATGIDYLAFSAHKAYAPFGSGALVARKGLLAFDAAEREVIRASGEENAAGIAALGRALVVLRRIGLEVIQREEQALTARALRGLARIPGVVVHGVKDPDSPRFARRGGVITFDVKGLTPGRVVRELAERGGIGARSGCHCAHLLIKRLVGVPPFFEGLQRGIVTLFPGLELPGVARVSFGLESGEGDVDTFLEVLEAIARRRPSRTPPAEVRRRIAAFVEARVEAVYGRATDPAFR